MNPSVKNGKFPSTAADLPFQRELAEQFTAAAAAGVLPAALLITGPEASGKKELARLTAAVLLSGQNPPDQKTLELLRSGAHFDYFEPEPDKTLIRVGDLRSSLNEGLSEKPAISKRRVFLIDFDYLSEAGQNILLKSLEEPPYFANFILTASAKSQVIPTVLSRAETHAIKRASLAEIKYYLKKAGYDELKADIAAAYSAGIYRKAVDLLESEEFFALRKEAAEVFFELPAMRLSRVFGQAFNFFQENKDQVDDILEVWAHLLADMTVYILDSSAVLTEKDYTADIKKAAEELKSKAEAGDNLPADCIKSASDLLLLIKEALEGNTSFEMSVSNFLAAFKDALNGETAEIFEYPGEWEKEDKL